MFRNAPSGLLESEVEVPLPAIQGSRSLLSPPAQRALPCYPYFLMAVLKPWLFSVHLIFPLLRSGSRLSAWSPPGMTAREHSPVQATLLSLEAGGRCPAERVPVSPYGERAYQPGQQVQQATADPEFHRRAVLTVFFVEGEHILRTETESDGGGRGSVSNQHLRRLVMVLI